MKFWSRIIVGWVGVFSYWAAPAYSVTVDVAVSGISFVPPDVTINAGDSVHWTGIAPFHNVAESADAASNVYNGTGFRSGNVGAVADFTHTFNTPGMYFYICEPHAIPGMKGTVTVNAVAPVPAVSTWGMAVFATVMTGAGCTVLHGRRRLTSTTRA